MLPQPFVILNFDFSHNLGHHIQHFLNELPNRLSYLRSTIDEPLFQLWIEVSGFLKQFLFGPVIPVLMVDAGPVAEEEVERVVGHLLLIM